MKRSNKRIFLIIAIISLIAAIATSTYLMIKVPKYVLKDENKTYKYEDLFNNIYIPALKASITKTDKIWPSYISDSIIKLDILKDNNLKSTYTATVESFNTFDEAKKRHYGEDYKINNEWDEEVLSESEIKTLATRVMKNEEDQFVSYCSYEYSLEDKIVSIHDYLCDPTTDKTFALLDKIKAYIETSNNNAETLKNKMQNTILLGDYKFKDIDKIEYITPAYFPVKNDNYMIFIYTSNNHKDITFEKEKTYDNLTIKYIEIEDNGVIKVPNEIYVSITNNNIQSETLYLSIRANELKNEKYEDEELYEIILEILNSIIEKADK